MVLLVSDLQDGLMREYSKVKYRDKLIKLKETGKVDNDVLRAVLLSRAKAAGFSGKIKVLKEILRPDAFARVLKGWATYS